MRWCHTVCLVQHMLSHVRHLYIAFNYCLVETMLCLKGQFSSAEKNRPVFNFVAMSVFQMARQGAYQDAKEHNHSVYSKKFKILKFGDNVVFGGQWRFLNSKDQIPFSSLSNVFLKHLSLAGGSNYWGSLWVGSNSDDSGLLLLDWMSG